LNVTAAGSHQLVDPDSGWVNPDDIGSSYPSRNIVASVSWLFGMP
jgi:hypothetical protein